MIPILYKSDETAFDTNGLGILTDAIDATVEEELNGVFELEMKYPVTGIHFSEIVRRSIILAEPNPISRPQPFRVYRITKPLNGMVKVYARHLAYDLKGKPVSPFSASGAALTLQGFKDYSVSDHAFDFYTDKSAAGNFSVAVPTPIWSLLGGQRGSVLDVFGGEYEFDRWSVTLLTRRGMDRGVSIRYGKNLTSFEQDENCASCCTGLYPYWTDTDGNVTELPEKVILAPGDYGYEDIRPMDFSDEWEETPTEEQLRARTEKYITDNEVGVPEVSWTVEFAALEQTEEYRGMALLERVLLGDTVHVEFPEMNVSASARAVSVKYKPLLERYEKITLGRVRSNLADTIVKQKQEIEKKPNADAIERAVSIASKAILNAKGGSVRILDTDGDGKDDTIYIADNPDPALAKKVWRWNYEGWAASKTGYDGPFTMAATLDAGLLADFVTAANLVAGTIQSADGEAFFLDLDNGILRMKAMEEIKGTISGIENDISKIEGIDGVFFYIKYSEYADGHEMTDAPDENTVYMGTCSTGETTAPTDYTKYTWVKIKGNDGAPSKPGADGKTQYLHIKYSDDGKTFTEPENLLPTDFTSWKTGGHGYTDPYRIYYPTLIKIDGGIYTNKTNYPTSEAITWSFTRYTEEQKILYTSSGRKDGEIELSSGYVKIGLVSTDTTWTYETFRAAFENGEIVPEFHKKGTQGERLGAYIGTLVDFVEADSNNFDDYTWKKFTEDVDEELDDIRQTVEERYTSSINTAEAIILSALESYVQTSNYEEFRQTVETQLEVMAGEIEMNFTATTEQIANVDGTVQSEFNKLYKYIKFSGETAIEIGSGNSAITLEVDNEKGIVFKKNGVQFGLWDGENFYTGNIIIGVNERAQFGAFAFVPRTDGSLSFLKVGG